MGPMKGVKVVFTHDTEVALAAAAALVNTGLQSEEQLPDVAALDAFVEQWGWTGTARATRPSCRGPGPAAAARPAVEGDEDEAVEIVNGMLRRVPRAAPARAARRLGLPRPRHLAGRPARRPRMAVEAAMAISDVIRGKELRRLRVCGAGDCDDVLVDLSKNRSRRFCDTTCANRTNVAAFRARRAAR